MVLLASTDVVPHSQVPAAGSRRPAGSLLRQQGAWGHCQTSRCISSSGIEADGGPTHSIVHLGEVVRLAMTVLPASKGALQRQVEEGICAIRGLLGAQPTRMVLTGLTVFLRSAEDRPACERMFEQAFGPELPVMHFVYQVPGSGAALAIEAWGIGGPGVAVEHHGPRSLSVSYADIRWIHCGGIESKANVPGAHEQTLGVLNGLQRELEAAGAAWEDVVRTWFYLGDITGPDPHGQRYSELNRARSEVFESVHFGQTLMQGRNSHKLYPASTGIGMTGRGLAGGCLALQTRRAGAHLVALENPGQTPAYCYAPCYSPHSPKFSRAMSVLLGDYATTWISGTASIVNAESVFPGDIERQTHQTLDNIERLIAPENFALHGVPRAGATLADLAKVRVYVKRMEDYPRCRAVCERRLGLVPAIYTVADICRPELLVEIEGVAFSPLSPPCATGGEVPE